jgi:Ca-activated chloride channel family protein
MVREVPVKRRHVVAGLAVLAGLLPPAPAAAQPGRSAVTAGNRLYAEGRFEEAHEQYLEALRAAPDSPIVPFNNGNALYRSDEFQRAMEGYRQAAESGDAAVEAQAWYNLGNALYRQQQLQPALEAYKQALRRNPADVDAKHNLELALEQLQEQQWPEGERRKK